MEPFITQHFNVLKDYWQGTQKWYNLKHSLKYRTFSIAQPMNSNGKYIMNHSFVTGENNGKGDISKSTYSQDYVDKKIRGGVIKNKYFKYLTFEDKLQQQIIRNNLKEGYTIIFPTQSANDSAAYLSGIYEKKDKNDQKNCTYKDLFWMIINDRKTSGKLRLNSSKTLLMSIVNIYPNELKIKSNPYYSYNIKGSGYGAKLKVITDSNKLLGIKVISQGNNYKYGDKIIFKNLLDNNKELIIKLGINDIEDIGKPSDDYLYYLNIFYILRYHQNKIIGLTPVNYHEMGLMGWSVNGQMVSRLLNEFSNKSSSYWVVEQFLKKRNIKNTADFWPKPLFGIIGSAGSLKCYNNKICHEYCCKKSRNLEFLKDFTNDLSKKDWFGYNYSCTKLPHCSNYYQSKGSNGNGCCPFFPFTSREYNNYIGILKKYKYNGDENCKSVYDNIQYSLNIGLEPVYSWGIEDWYTHTPVITYQSKYDIYADPWAATSYINILNYWTNNRFNYRCILNEKSNIHGLSSEYQVQELTEFIKKHLNKKENLDRLDIIMILVLIIILSVIFILYIKFPKKLK